MNRIVAMYFSPTGTTKKVVNGIAQQITQDLDVEMDEFDFTLPAARNTEVKFNRQDVVIFGVPVYAGRVPNVLLKYLHTVAGNGALAVAVVLYGNRNYDDALIELKDLLVANEFTVIAGGAFVGEHSFSKILASDRPDKEDMSIVRNFAKKIAQKINSKNEFANVHVKGNTPYRKHYVPKDKNGEPADIRKVTPKTNADCIDCKLCAKVCPMGSINQENVSLFNGICIKCGACIKKCPNQAKYYDDENYLKHKHELEVEFAERREPELFI